MAATPRKHIDIGALFEFARLRAELDTASKAHLEDCAVCLDRVSWMQTAAETGSDERVYEPPEAAIENVLRLVRQPGQLKRLGKFVTASLTFDSSTSVARAGVRRAESASREVTFEADDVEIAISFRPSGQRKLTVAGQVLMKDSSPVETDSARAEIVQEGDHIESCPLSQWGEFIFPDLADGEYSLQIHLRDRTIRIPALR